MKTAKNIKIAALISVLFAGLALSDTFRNLKTGDTFTGFSTTRSVGPRTLVYNSQKDKFEPIVIKEWQITIDQKGRRNRAVIIPIKQEKILLSKVISEKVADALIDASNKGPRFIILEMDSPGGRGEYMKIIVDAITDKIKCPVVAYISGGPYAGVYSSAVGIALACDKIFMAGHSTMGSVAPMAGAGDLEEHKLKYSPPSLRIYGGFLSALAQQNGRVSAVAAAMVDDNIDILLVKDPQGNASYVSRSDRSPSQTIVKSLTKQDFVTVEDDQQEKQIVKKYTINLTAAEAVEVGMADKVVESRTDLLSALDSKDVDIVSGPDFKRDVRRFEANERNMRSIYASIEYLEQRVAELDQQIYQMSLRQDESTVTREYYRNEGRWSRTLGFEDSDDTPGDRDRYIGSSGRQREVAEREIVMETQNIGVTIEDLLFDLEITLSNLLDDYSAAVNFANRYPGLLPVGVSLSDLQKKYDQVAVMYDDLVIR